MATVDPNLIDDLRARGLLIQMSGGGELEGYLNSGPRTLYCGFDPTAKSLHIGNLVPLLALKRFQLAGHKPIAVVGGATGLIGDPSFKAQERALNSREVVAQWVESLKRQISVFIDFEHGDNAALLVNNLDWTQPLDVLTYLRDIGKHFSVSNMVHKESVKQRIDREGEGISYTEFSYMVLQSLDFAELYQRYGCTLQIGGSDQWGNITGGIDLVRRLHGGTAYGLTLALVTKADGSKFGKTETGTVWLDPALTSPYAFYQFWLNSADADVYKFLRYFTFLPVGEIDSIEEADKAAQGRPQAQRILAEEVTKLVHGDQGLAAAERITQALFNSDVSELTEEDFEHLKLDGLPFSELRADQLTDKPLTQLLVECGMATSGKQVKDALARRAVAINNAEKDEGDNMPATASFPREKAYFGRFFIAKLGKKKYHLFELK